MLNYNNKYNLNFGIKFKLSPETIRAAETSTGLTYEEMTRLPLSETTKLIEPKPIKKVFQTKVVKELLRITLDNGEYFECTPDHRLMLRDGKYIEAQHIGQGTSLMPLYRKYSKSGLIGYRLVYQPEENKWHYEHRNFCIF